MRPEVFTYEARKGFSWFCKYLWSEDQVVPWLIENLYVNPEDRIVAPSKPTSAQVKGMLQAIYLADRPVSRFSETGSLKYCCVQLREKAVAELEGVHAT